MAAECRIYGDWSRWFGSSSPPHPLLGRTQAVLPLVIVIIRVIHMAIDALSCIKTSMITYCSLFPISPSGPRLTLTSRRRILNAAEAPMQEPDAQLAELQERIAHVLRRL